MSDDLPDLPEDLVPPSSTRARTHVPEQGGVWARLNIRDLVAQAVVQLRDDDPELYRRLFERRADLPLMQLVKDLPEPREPEE